MYSNNNSLYTTETNRSMQCKVDPCLPRRNSVDVEIWKRDVDARFVGAVEEIVALNVTWVQTGEVG